jgi:exonuclease VII large subunit
MHYLKRFRWTLLAATLSAAGPAFAHHSFSAEFDGSKAVTLTGEVTKLEWSNPHAYLYLDVKDETGTVSNWKIELGSPNNLTRLGWKRATVQVGDQVTVEGSLGRYKPNLANAKSAILLRTGERLGAGSSQAPP